MGNGLHLYSALSSPQRPQSALHYNQSFTHSYTRSHTDTVVSYNVAPAALGQTDRSRVPDTGATKPSDHYQQAKRVTCPRTQRLRQTDRAGIRPGNPQITGQTSTTVAISKIH
ncbi:hypothetical protein CRENBAI_026887 [Crenichthys baileyi]|uniref:Uncharacterized protein n=1 Tax=Crenichthys baileyi TaxID=28760 RepID=A0AAV9RH84_9TELE